MMKLHIVDSKRSTINCIEGINGRKCTTMSSNMSNRARNVSTNLESDRRSLCIQHGALLCEQNWESMLFICLRRMDLDLSCSQGMIWVNGSKGVRSKLQTPRMSQSFIYEDVICHHDCPQRIVLDHGSENLDLTKDLLEYYKIKRMVVSVYHPQANDLVERGHDFIVNSLSKYCSKKPEEWVNYLPLALWAGRVSIWRSIGYSSFEVRDHREVVLYHNR